jgi:hypothetical protein
MRLLAVSLIAASLACAGCSGPVLVHDSAGKPIAGATVVPIGPLFRGVAATTDADGKALVGIHVSGKTERVSVTKAGFNPVELPVPERWPLEVVLVRSGALVAGTRPASRR